MSIVWRSLGDAFLCSLVPDTIVRAKRLRHLDLRSTALGTRSPPMLASMVNAMLPPLESLDVSWNEFRGACSCVFEALGGSQVGNLQRLNISFCGCAAAAAHSRRCCGWLYPPSPSTLMRARGSRRLDDSVAGALGAMIGTNNKLTELDVSQNRLRAPTGEVQCS